MTRRADHIIDMLTNELARGRALLPAIVAATLGSHGLRPSETGWVLHHVFGISMPEAVHMATISSAAEDAHITVSPGAFLPTRDEEGPRHYARP